MPETASPNGTVLTCTLWLAVDEVDAVVLSMLARGVEMKRCFAPLPKISPPCIERGISDQLPGSFLDPLTQRRVV
jgi:hypothetical protein